MVLRAVKLWGVLCAVPLAVTLTLVHVVSQEVPQPYMDEEFHVRQTAAYLDGRWEEWDPKITTPPGLYFVGWLWGSLLPLPLLPSLRSLNAVLHCVANSLLLHTLTRSTHTTLAVLSFPLLFFFALLYYTDVASVTAILLHYFLVKTQPRWCTPALLVVGAWAVLLRQTNLIWIGTFHSLSILQGASLYEWIRLTFTAHLPIVILVIMSGAFFVSNGNSVVLGDKANHTPCFHPTQLVYLASCIPVFFPALSLRALVSRSGKTSSLLAVLAVWMAFAVECLRAHTIPHPFLLSDNRHYTFYLWRRLRLGVEGSYVPYLTLLPLSVVGVMATHWVCREVPRITTALLMLATAVTLFPSPLLEFRYYIIPMVILYLTAQNKGLLHTADHVVQLLFGAVVNAVTIYVFLFCPFEAPDGSTGRFMY